MMAITPSLNASSRLLSIIPLFVGIYPPNAPAKLRALSEKQASRQLQPVVGHFLPLVNFS
jgi:hypothetical protein